MKITEQNFINEISLGNEKALEYCMLHYGGLVRSVIHRHIGNLTLSMKRIASTRYSSQYGNILIPTVRRKIPLPTGSQGWPG